MLNKYNMFSNSKIIVSIIVIMIFLIIEQPYSEVVVASGYRLGLTLRTNRALGPQAFGDCSVILM